MYGENIDGSRVSRVSPCIGQRLSLPGGAPRGTWQRGDEGDSWENMDIGDGGGATLEDQNGLNGSCVKSIVVNAFDSFDLFCSSKNGMGIGRTNPKIEY